MIRCALSSCSVLLAKGRSSKPMPNATFQRRSKSARDLASSSNTPSWTCKSNAVASRLGGHSDARYPSNRGRRSARPGTALVGARRGTRRRSPAPHDPDKDGRSRSGPTVSRASQAPPRRFLRGVYSSPAHGDFSATLLGFLGISFGRSPLWPRSGRAPDRERWGGVASNLALYLKVIEPPAELPL